MPENQPDQPRSPEPKRNTAYEPEKAPPVPQPRQGDDKPDEGTRPGQITTENDDGQG